MVFSDASGKGGIVQEIDFILNTNDTSYPIAQKTRNINRRLDDVVSLILQCDGRWQWDDQNQTDLPIGVTTLVPEQPDYSLTGSTFLDITRVEVKDSNGNYVLLQPIDQREVTDQSLTEFQKTSGTPRFYDKVGDSLFLYPKPSSSGVTTAQGLKVYFQRQASYFVVTDTTKCAGFAPLYHRLLSLGAAMDYAMANEMTTKINIISPQIEKLQTGLVAFYSARNKDENVRMRPRRENFGQDGNGYVMSDKRAF